MFFEHRKFA